MDMASPWISMGIPIETHGKANGNPWGCHVHTARANAHNARLGSFSDEDKPWVSAFLRLIAEHKKTEEAFMLEARRETWLLFSKFSEEFLQKVMDKFEEHVCIEECPSWPEAAANDQKHKSKKKHREQRKPQKHTRTKAIK